MRKVEYRGERKGGEGEVGEGGEENNDPHLFYPCPLIPRPLPKFIFHVYNKSREEYPPGFLMFQF